MPSKIQYQQVQGDRSDECEAPLASRKRKWHPGSFSDKLIRIVFLLSALGHVLWVLLWINYQSHSISLCKEESPYAKLLQNIPKPISRPGPNSLLSVDDWASPLADTGVVALTDEFVMKNNLPPSQRWPWDPSKGVYLLQGYHNLHCIQNIYKAISGYRNGTVQLAPESHIDHCLITLREEIICTADDTPRWTGGFGGQNRLCRDWSKLQTWAEAHSACYAEPEDYQNERKKSENYIRCPDGSHPRQRSSRPYSE